MSLNTITLKKYAPSELETYYSVVKEDKVMHYISGKGLTLGEAREKFESILKLNSENDGVGYFKVYNDKDEFIGDGKLEWYSLDPSKIEVGYILKEEFWGRGYGTMICAMLLSIADANWPTRDIVGIIDPENAASKRILEKFGLKSFFVGVEDDLPTEKLILKR